MAGVISVGAMALGLTLRQDQIHLLPLAMAGALAILAVLLMLAWRKNAREWQRLDQG